MGVAPPVDRSEVDLAGHSSVKSPSTAPLDPTGEWKPPRVPMIWAVISSATVSSDSAWGTWARADQRGRLSGPPAGGGAGGTDGMIDVPLALDKDVDELSAAAVTECLGHVREGVEQCILRSPIAHTRTSSNNYLTM